MVLAKMKRKYLYITQQPFYHFRKLSPTKQPANKIQPSNSPEQKTNQKYIMALIKYKESTNLAAKILVYCHYDRYRSERCLT